MFVREEGIVNCYESKLINGSNFLLALRIFEFQISTKMSGNRGIFLPFGFLLIRLFHRALLFSRIFEFNLQFDLHFKRIRLFVSYHLEPILALTCDGYTHSFQLIMKIFYQKTFSFLLMSVLNSNC